MSPPHQILLVEDDDTLRRLLSDQMERLGYEVASAPNKGEARRLAGSQPPDLILTDMSLPDGDGLELIGELAGACPVIAMTAFGTVDQAMRAVRAGATDYLFKPVSATMLEFALRKVFAMIEMERDLRYLRDEARSKSDATVYGDGRDAEQIRQLVALYSKAESPVLICGESGTGKERVARAIHDTSARSTRRFLPLDTAGAAESNLAVELFGEENDSDRDGPVVSHRGLLEAASGGTVYLNDIARLPLTAQGMLLRLMETGTFRRIGGVRSISADVRVILGTESDLHALVEDGRFRPELYYYLRGLRIDVPPLRERREDIAALAHHFVDNRTFARGMRKSLAPKTLKALMGYDWPGNIRELRNTLERALILSGDAPDLLPEHLALPGRSGDATGKVVLSYDAPPPIEKLREDYLKLLVERFEGNRVRIAETMGISERNTYRLISKMDK